MAQKARQLYHSVKDKGQQFLDKTGIKAFLFAPLETAAVADSVAEVIPPPVELAAISDVKEDALVPDMDQDGDAEKKASIVYGEGSTEESGT
jgi:hypothetical protein